MTGFLIDFENKLLRQTDRHKSIDNAVYADLEYSIYSLMGRKNLLLPITHILHFDKHKKQ